MIKAIGALVALAAIATPLATGWAAQLKGPVRVASPAGPGHKICAPGVLFSYYYLPPSQGGAYVKKDMCTGVVTVVNGG